MSPGQPKLKRHPARRNLLKLYGAERRWTMRGRFILRMKQRREMRREVERERRWFEAYGREFDEMVRGVEAELSRTAGNEPMPRWTSACDGVFVLRGTEEVAR